MSILQNGEPWRLDHLDVVDHTCCDCGLRHIIIVNVDKKGKKVSLKFYRDDFETEEIRKEERIIVYRKKDKKTLKQGKK